MIIKKKRRLTAGIAISIAAAVLIGAGAAVFWYKQSLRPVDANNKQTVRVNITKGMGGGEIAAMLEQRKMIRSALAFSVYTRLHGAGKGFQTGVYSLDTAQSLPDIIKHLTSGKSDERAITFYPEATLMPKKRNSDGREVFTVLKKYGFSDEQITTALQARYTGDVLKSRPEGASLEGYVFGETYFVPVDYRPEQIIQRAINEFDSVVKKYDLEKKFAARGLTLYQGITLASIVQKESKGCGGALVCDDQRRIASVFHNRLKANMPLGSDVTYHYAADQTGVARSHTLDSPYNTRLKSGLPPGPIATPGISALNAVADPVETDFLFFLSGDDHVTYFGKTDAEHQENIRKHCHQKCQLP